MYTDQLVVTIDPAPSLLDSRVTISNTIPVYGQLMPGSESVRLPRTSSRSLNQREFEA